jgi:formylmethanofuran dehydrogenase subunit D
MSDTFILIPGRTSRQGTGLNQGKYSEAYLDEINTLKMNPDDMERLQVADGDQVRMWNDEGDVRVGVKSGKAELPPGLLFISYGDISSRFMPGETHGTGMPDSKGMEVFVEKASAGE